MSLRLPDQHVGLDLTIRFSASLPDLLLTVPSSSHATTSTLKQQIRARLPSEYANRRIRLIHAGKALADDALLSTSLNRPLSRPPSRVATPGPYDDSDRASPRGKGKAPVRDPPALSRIYIHCSIGDVVLSAAELAAEAALARPENERATRDPTQTSAGAAAEAEATAPAPRGFDRLLSTGFSASEVQSLRLQFLAIQAHTHTPDTMPSPNTLRDLEDEWLDNSTNGADGMGAGGPGGGAGGVADEDGYAGALDDMIWGTAMGFFWPLGCLMWAIREEGIWSQRRKMAVAVGFMLNIGLGIVRYTA